MSQFSSSIKLYRQQQNLTQKKMAEMIGTTERAYQYYESGTREPNLETLINIANIFDISVDYLLGRTNNPISHKSISK